MVIAWRGGMYNIGGEGQFLVGGLVGALAAKLLLHAASIPGPLVTTAILLGSIIGGALWAGIAAWLYVGRGVQVVISTILLNFVAIQLLGWAVEGPLQEGKGQLPQTDQLPAAFMLWRPERQMDFHAGVFIALAVALVIQVVLYRTVFGFRLRLVGANPRAARASRINAKGIQFATLALSGALCGLAGGVEYTGIAGVLGTDYSQGSGFMAIPVALLGGLDPLGTVLSALFFGAVFAGTENLARFTSSGTTLLYVVQAAAVLGLVGFRALSARNPVQAEAT
jgi:simple sugar transport system permease protein